MPAQFSDSTPKITLNPEGNEPADVCIANISPKERQKRKQFGIMQIVFGLVILTALLLLGADKAWRLPLFFMFAAGTSSIFQALDKTWVLLAARGARLTSNKEEMIEDKREVLKIRWQAMKVIVKGTLAGAALTALVMLIP